MSKSKLLTCPNCNVQNLKLFQLNLEEAVYLCINNNCAYPRGNQCIIVKRSAENINDYEDEIINEIEKIDLDSFVDGALENMFN